MIRRPPRSTPFPTRRSSDLVERLRRQRTGHIADDDIGAARLQSRLPAFLKAARDADQRDDGGDADGDAQQRQPGSNRAAHEPAHDDGEKTHVEAGPDTMCPSFICTTPDSRAAIYKSCVTSTRGICFSRWSRTIS